MNFKAKIIILLIMAIPIKNFGQKLKYIHPSEVKWILAHPFIARKAYKISKRAGQVATAQKFNPQLDGDDNGGMVDAFRHCFWMALLVQEISPKAAYKLGIAHEKGNYRDFKKKRYEDGAVPDSVASEMDLKNNKIGLELGQEYMGVDEETLKQVVLNAVINGECWKIKKDSAGNSLDAEGNIIPQNKLENNWRTPRVLVPSDYKFDD